MLQLFRTNHFFANIFLFLYAGLLRFPSFLQTPALEYSKGNLFSEWVYALIGKQGWVPETIALLLIVSQAILINTTVIQKRLGKDFSLLPGLFYILLCSFIPDFLYLSPLLMGNTFLLLAISELFNTYKKYHCGTNIFNFGFWIAIASLFYFPFLYFTLLGFWGLNTLRAFKLKERLMLLTGLISAYILLFTYFFWIEKQDIFLHTTIIQHLYIGFSGLSSLLENPNWILWVKSGLWAMVILIVFSGVNIYYQKKTIDLQKYISILYWTLFIGLGLLLFQKEIHLDFLLILTIPCGIFLSISFEYIKSHTLAEILHLLLLIVVLTLHLITVFGI